MRYSLVELITSQLRERGMNKTEAELIGKDVQKAMEDNLAGGDEVVLGRIGELSVKTAAPKMARNPRTGEEISVPAQETVKFKRYRAFRKHMNAQG